MPTPITTPEDEAGSQRSRIPQWVLAGFLSLLFLASGVGKLVASEAAAEGFEGWGYPLWFMYVVGTGEALGALLLLAPSKNVFGAPLRFWGATVLGSIMVGAVGTHLVHAEHPMMLLTLGLLAGTTHLARTSRPKRGRLR